jgi:hypothetical protein
VFIFASEKAGVAQLVERQPSKLNVASSNLVSRSTNLILMDEVFLWNKVCFFEKAREEVYPECRRRKPGLPLNKAL